MPSGSAKIHAFKVRAAEGSQPLETVLETIQHDPIADRERLVSHSGVRIDDISNIDGVWLMDFVLERYEGPGRVTPNAETQDFQMSEDDRFGEEAAALFDPESDHLICQYNHRGPKSGRMSGYFGVYDDNHANSYELDIVLDPAAQAKLQRMTVARKLHVGVDPGSLTQADRDTNLAMTYAAEAEDRYGANHIEMLISVKGGRTERLRGPIRQLMNSVRGITGRSPEAVSSLKFYGKEADDLPIEELDLLGQRLKEKVTGLPIGEGRRLTRDSRYNALRRVWDQWKRTLNA